MSRDKVLSLLFNDYEKTCVGESNSTKVVSPFKTSGPFYCVNPLASVDVGHNRKPHYSYMKPRRADINVKEFRNFVFEIDSLSLGDQLAVIEACGIDFSAIVYSGGKSYHCLVCLDFNLGGEHTDNGIRNYKQIWSRIAARIDKSANDLGLATPVVDPSCKNPSRFTRYPDFVSKDRKPQVVVKWAESRFSREQFDSMLSECPEVKNTFCKAIKSGDVESVNQFWEVASQGLKNAIRYPVWASASAGLYPEALRVVLWAIDETNVDKDLLIKLFEKSVFRQYEHVAYPQEKWYTAIDDAYRLKGINNG